jgi:hypothetical protein
MSDLFTRLVDRSTGALPVLKPVRVSHYAAAARRVDDGVPWPEETVEVELAGSSSDVRAPAEPSARDSIASASTPRSFNSTLFPADIKAEAHSRPFVVMAGQEPATSTPMVRGSAPKDGSAALEGIGQPGTRELTGGPSGISAPVDARQATTAENAARQRTPDSSLHAGAPSGKLGGPDQLIEAPREGRDHESSSAGRGTGQSDVAATVSSLLPAPSQSNSRAWIAEAAWRAAVIRHRAEPRPSPRRLDERHEEAPPRQWRPLLASGTNHPDGNGPSDDGPLLRRDAGPVVNVTIGRVELRASISSGATRAAKQPESRPRLSLEEYLERREAGRA